MSRSLGGRSLTTRSPIEISPEVISSSPATMRSVVVLPQPDGPTKTMNSLSRMVRFTSLTACTSSYFLLRSLRTTCAIGRSPSNRFPEVGCSGLWPPILAQLWRVVPAHRAGRAGLLPPAGRPGGRARRVRRRGLLLPVVGHDHLDGRPDLLGVGHRPGGEVLLGLEHLGEERVLLGLGLVHFVDGRELGLEDVVRRLEDLHAVL